MSFWGLSMSKNKQLPSNHEIAQYIDSDVPLRQLEHDLLMAELEPLELEPLKELELLELEPLPEIEIAKEFEQLDKIKTDLLSDLRGLDDE